MKRFLLLSIALLVTGATPARADEDSFPRPAELESDIQFWIRVYTEVSTRAGYIHDSRNLDVVYETLELPTGISGRAQSRITEAAKRRIRTALLSLARGKRSGLTADEQRVLARWPDGVSNATLRAAAENVRFQLGQADKFRAGLVRSGAWEPHIRDTFTDMGLPVELAALPHVESSYTPHAYSRIGAAGLWQFTRSTGRRYMRVDHVVDERLDPFRATVAAGRLLEQNRETTGSWPLAITAYNHGAAGMRRAVKQVGTTDIATILRKYRSRSFGFASRNFYLEFLAAVDVDFHSEKYFGPLLLDAPIEYETLELPYFTTATTLQRALGVELASLQAANPALRGPIWEGSKYLPRGYTIRIPRDELVKPVSTALADIPTSHRFASQVPDTTHTVRRGETVSTIAARYGVRIRDIVALNGLRSSNRIRVGQRLRLPDMSGRTRLVRIEPETPIEPPADGTYTVRRGDTVSSIARRFGLDESELLRNNRLPNRNRIFVGQTLQLAAVEPESLAAEDPHPETSVALSAPAPSVAPEPVADEVDDSIDEAAAEAVAEAEDDSEPVEIASIQETGLVTADEVDEVEASTDLVADPSDYSVAPDGTIEVQASETLGHYADWLGVQTHRLRQINGMSYGQDLQLGRRLKLDFSRTTPTEFEQRRREYQEGIQAAFFEQYEISGTRVHVMRRGDSLWSLSRHRYQVPLWLLRQYNPDVDFGSLTAGTRLNIPIVRPHQSGDEAEAPPSGTAARMTALSAGG